MAKILISFLGASKYKTYNYCFEDKTAQDQFLVKFLREKLEIDKTFLIGTIKSNWDELYKALFNPRKDDEISTLSYNTLQKAKGCNDIQTIDTYLECAKSAISFFEQELDGGIVLFKSEKEKDDDDILKYNSSSILKLNNKIADGDEIYLDITHSFRSLPLYVMQLLSYINQVRDKVKIEKILYAQIPDNQDNSKSVEVIDMNKGEYGIMNINNWITGAYAFKNFGNAYQIADLMGTTTEEGKALMKFSDEINLNHLSSIADIDSIKSKCSSVSNEIAKILVPNTIDAFTNEIVKFAKKDSSDNYIIDSQFLLNVAQFQCFRRNYASAYLCVLQSLLFFVCEQYSLEINYQNTEKAKNVLGRKPEGTSGLKDFKEYLKKKIKDEGCFSDANKIGIFIDQTAKDFRNLPKGGLDPVIIQTKLSTAIDVAEVNNLVAFVKSNNYNDEDKLDIKNIDKLNCLQILYWLVNNTRNCIAHPKVSNITLMDMVSILNKCTEFLQLVYSKFSL